MLPVISRTMIRAASRLSPKMIVYHLKRAGRNKLCRVAPSLYAKYIDRVRRTVPPLSSVRDPMLAVAEIVAKFYYDEYRGEIEDAARGVFTLFGQRVDFGSVDAIDWHHQIDTETDFHLWRMKLGHMGFVCPMLVDGDAGMLDAVDRIITGYGRYADFKRPGCFSSYWFPYSVSHRVLAILSGYLIARSKRRLSPQLDIVITEFLRWSIAFVQANIEHELKNNHVERNLAAICLYYGCVDTVPRDLARRVDVEVREIIRETVLGDGMIAERSAMYQGLSVMALHVFATTPFLSEATRALATETLRKAEFAWAVMTHPDGEIALFNDSWFAEVPRSRALVQTRQFKPVEVLADAGYARLEEEGIFVLFDAGPIGPRWNPGHGHADFLAVEVDLAGARFIVDPGTFQYSTGPRRRFERSARSHNGPVFDGVEPVEYHGCFKVGKMAAAYLDSPDWVAGVVGSLDLADGSVRREVSLLGGVVRCVDSWHGAGKGGVRLLVQGEWALVAWDARSATFQRGRTRAHIELMEGRIVDLGKAEWSRRYLISEAAMALMLEPVVTGLESARLVWVVSHGSTHGGRMPAQAAFR